MATKGVITGSCTQQTTRYAPKLYWKAISQSIVNNQTTIRVWSFVTKKYSTTYDWNGNCVGWVMNADGQNRTKGTFNSNSDSGWTYPGGWTDSGYVVSTYDTELIPESSPAYQDFVITHDSDGKKTLNISHSYSLDSSGYGPGDVSISGQITLDTIPRASVINSLSAITASHGEGNKTLTANITVYSGSFNHDFTLKLGSTTIAIFNDQVIAAGTADKTFTITEAMQDAILAALPTATSGTLTLVCQTQNGTENVGSSVSKSATVSVDSDIKPSMGSISFSELTTNPAMASIVGKFVKSLSNVRITVGNATAGYGATGITSYNINYNGGNYSGQQRDTGLLNWSGTKTVTVTATDSRGRTNQNTLDMNALNYTVPTITTFSAVRNSGDVTLLDVTRVGTAASLINSTERNDIKAEIYTRVAGTSTWYLKHTEGFTSVLTAINDTITIGTTGDYAADSSYEVKVVLYDNFNNGAAYSTTTVSTEAIKFDWGFAGSGIGVGKYWEKGSLDVGGMIFQNNEALAISYYEQMNGVDLNNLHSKDSGFMFSNAQYGTNINIPANKYFGMIHVRNPYSDVVGADSDPNDRAYQIWMGDTAGEIYWRTYQGSSYGWHGWEKIWTAANDGSGSGLDADKLEGYHASAGGTASTIPIRDSSGDMYSRLFRSTYTNQTTISGAMAFRVSTTDNYIRFCSDKNAIMSWLTCLPLGGGTMTGHIAMANNDITGVNKIVINDEGPSEGLVFADGTWFNNESSTKVTIDFNGAGGRYLALYPYASSGKYAIWDDEGTGGSGGEPTLRPNADSYGYVGTSSHRWYRMYRNAAYSSSDENIKKNIAKHDTGGVLEDLDLFDIYSYTFNKEDGAAYHLGVLVQELPSILTDNDMYGDGLAIEDLSLTVFALAAIKELKAIVLKQDEKIKKLEGDYGVAA